MNDYVIGWATFGFILIGLEFLLPGAIAGFLGLACVIVATLMHFGIISGIVEVLLTWFILSIFLIAVVRTFCIRFFPGEETVHKTDEDELVQGTMVTVTEDIKPEKTGRIEFGDTTWIASSSQSIKAGEQAMIIGRNGNQWIVKSL